MISRKRGLLAYYEQFGDEQVLEYAKSTVEHLYLPTAGMFDGYPVQRDEKGRDVSGHSTGEQEGWILSSDMGCAFMSIDGLAHYYRVTKDANVLMLLNEMRVFIIMVFQRHRSEMVAPVQTQLLRELYKDECGRYMAGDILYAEVRVAKEFEHMIEDTETVSLDGRKLRPIIKYYDLPIASQWIM